MLSNLAAAAAGQADGGAQDHRFYVEKSENTVHFRGVLSDVTTLELLADVVVDGCTVDMGALSFASWIGLSNLRGYLAANGMKITMRHVPDAIFATIKLIEGLTDLVAFESAELPVRGKDGRRATQMVAFEGLDRQLSQGLEFGQVGAVDLVSPLRFLLPKAFRTGSPLLLAGTASPAERQALTFWNAYPAFSQASLDICVVMLKAGEGNVQHLLQEIRSGVDSCEKVLTLLDPSVRYTLKHRVDATIGVALTAFQTCIEALQQQCQHSHAASVITRDAVVAAPATALGLVPSLAGFFQTVGEFSTVASRLEVEGPRLGEKLAELRAIYVIKNAFAGAREPTPDVLEQIRAAFAIMDVLTDGDWLATRTQIMAEVAALEGLIGNLIVAMQIFDLVKQMIDHRTKEAAIFLSFYGDLICGDIAPAEVAVNIVNAVAASLVTDQEKHAFSFFMPFEAAQHAGAERSEPGDVLLF